MYYKTLIFFIVLFSGPNYSISYSQINTSTKTPVIIWADLGLKIIPTGTIYSPEGILCLNTMKKNNVFSFLYDNYSESNLFQ